MKDLVITSLDRLKWSDIRIWAESLRQTGYDGDMAVVTYRMDDVEVMKNSERLNITLLDASTDFTGNPVNHNEHPYGNSLVCRNRFFHMWWYLHSLMVNYRWVISVDARDVVFQSNPTTWLDNHPTDARILASSEGQLYKNEAWGMEDQIKAFGPVVWQLLMDNQPIKNAGVMTVAGYFAKELFLNLFFMSRQHPLAANDQASYNLMTATTLKDYTKLLTHDDGWACQCGTTLDPFKPQLKTTVTEGRPHYDTNGLFYSQDNLLYVIVHQYDRIPEAKVLVERRFAV